MMKKMLAMILALIMSLSLVACGSNNKANDKGNNAAEEKKEEQLRQELSGSKMTMIFQEPLTSLNPVLTIKKQMEEPLLLHTKL